jgi:hypothetical protein
MDTQTSLKFDIHVDSQLVRDKANNPLLSTSTSSNPFNNNITAEVVPSTSTSSKDVNNSRPGLSNRLNKNIQKTNQYNKKPLQPLNTDFKQQKSRNMSWHNPEGRRGKRGRDDDTESGRANDNHFGSTSGSSSAPPPPPSKRRKPCSRPNAREVFGEINEVRDWSPSA